MPSRASHTPKISTPSGPDLPCAGPPPPAYGLTWLFHTSGMCFWNVLLRATRAWPFSAHPQCSPFTSLPTWQASLVSTRASTQQSYCLCPLGGSALGSRYHAHSVLWGSEKVGSGALRQHEGAEEERRRLISSHLEGNRSLSKGGIQLNSNVHLQSQTWGQVGVGRMWHTHPRAGAHSAEIAPASLSLHTLRHTEPPWL